MNLSDNLKKIRKDKNLSQEQLAEKLGVSRQSVSKWESNQAYPEMDKVLQICQMFNLNVDELLNQNIKEVKEKKESKNNINKYIDDFLEFITKTIDMFSSMKFKDKIKCLFEQFVICILLLILFLIFGSIGSIIINNILSILPNNIYSFIYTMVEGLYILIALIIGFVILIHIFKVRYLDYYVIIKNQKEDIKEEETIEKDLKKTKEKIYLEKKEKIIIRDPNHSSYRFIKGLLKCILFIIKTIIFFISLISLIPLIFLIISTIISFVFIKTDLLFVGVLLGLLSAIMINLLFIYILYNFIFSKKIHKNRVVLLFMSSIIILSISIGLIIISIKDFNYINDINNDYYITTEEIINMEDNLYFDNVFSDQFKFEETNSNDIKIVCKHSKYHKCNINIYDNDVVIYIYQNETNIMDQIREYINIINKKEIINYYNQEIIVYTSKENIDKLIENRKNYIQDINENAMQEEINSLYDSLNEKNIKIRELENKIYKLENYIY